MTRLLPVIGLTVVFLVVAVTHVWSGRVSSRSSLLLDPTNPPTTASTAVAERISTPRSMGDLPLHPKVSVSQPPAITKPATSSISDSGIPPPPSAAPHAGESVEEDPNQVAVSVSPPDALGPEEAQAAAAEAVQRLQVDVTGSDRSPYQQITPVGALVKVENGAVTVMLAWEGTRRDGSVDTHRTPIRIGEPS